MPSSTIRCTCNSLPINRSDFPHCHLLFFSIHQTRRSADSTLYPHLHLKVLLTMNTKRELIALQSCGLPRKKILRPFFLFALMCTFFNFASSEFLLPFSSNHLDQFRQKHFKHNRHGHRKEPVHVLSLKDPLKNHLPDRR